MKNKKQQEKTNKDRKEQGEGGRSYRERVRAKLFCCAFMLGFFLVNI